MIAERKLLTSILKLTTGGPVRRELISRDARLSMEVANRTLENLSGMGLIQLGSKTVEASSDQRVRIALRAIKLRADPERVCKALRWIEFENIAAVAFEANNFAVKRRFRFKWAGRRWEVDVIGLREPMVVCVDCKHWLHGWRRSAIMKAVELQVMRTRTLVDALPSLFEEMGMVHWKNATLIPVVLSLVPGPFKVYNRVPIVPILQLQNFLDELPVHITSLMHFPAHLRER